MMIALRPGRSTADGSLLEQTLGAAVKDVQTVTPEGKSIGTLIEGVRFRDLATHYDARGAVSSSSIRAGSGTPIPLFSRIVS